MQEIAGAPRMKPVPWFLATVPRPNPEMVERIGVIALLDSVVKTHQTTIVSAPSGFGKTVAVTQWSADHRIRAPGLVSWLTLTDRVADYADVVRGILTALLRAARDRSDDPMYRAVSALFENPAHRPTFDVIGNIDSADPITVVVDDFHYAAGALGESAFLGFIEHAPQWLRLILISSGAIDPAMARLRLHGRIGVIGASHLVLSASEIAAVAERFGNPIPPETASALHAATQGWPAAVRLVLVSGPGISPIDVRGDLTDYIRTSVLGRMRSDLADFVLNTTVSDRLNGPLAAALSGRSDWSALMDECVAAGLFVERFGSGEEDVYQWHSMFVSHCRSILRHNAPSRWRQLNATAARHLASDNPLQAVEHAICAGDADLAAATLTNHWLELLLQSQTEALDGASTALIKAFGERPDLLLIRACCRALAGDVVNASQLSARAEMDETDWSPRTRFIADITRVLTSQEHGVIISAAIAAERALADRNIVSPSAYACALFVLGWAHSRIRGSAEASPLLEAAYHESGALGLTEVAERARQYLAFAAAGAGEFASAGRWLRKRSHAATVTPEPWMSHDGEGIELFTSGYVHFWRGDLRKASANFLSLDAAEGSGYPDVSRVMLALAVSTSNDRANFGVAEAALRRVDDAERHGVPWRIYKLASLARLAEAQGEKERALSYAAQLEQGCNVPMCSAIAAGVCRRLGELTLARRLADTAKLEVAQSYTRVYGLLTSALLDWSAGDHNAAHARLEESLSTAASEKVRYQFLDNPDQDCLDLLSAHATRTAYQTFLEEGILDCQAAATRLRSSASAHQLTSRELEVLALLRTPMTSLEIAAQLSVSINTLKTHQRAIYRKLGVGKRREAVRATNR